MTPKTQLASLVALLLLAAAAVLFWWPGGSATDAGTPGGRSSRPRPEAQRTDAGQPEVPSPRETLPDGAEKPGAETPGAKTPGTENTSASLLVRVVYGDDQSPAPDLRVSVSHYTAPNRLAPWRRTSSGKDGTAKFDGLPPGKLVLKTNRREDRYSTEVTAGGNEFTITLKDGVDIAGVVVDATGTPVPDATVILAGWAASSPRDAGRTDEHGRFLLRQTGRMTNVGARAKGHAPSLLVSVNAGAGARSEVRIVLPGAGGAVQGRVLDLDGSPVARAAVWLGNDPGFGRVITLPDGSQGMNTPRRLVVTDADGKFRAAGLPTGDQPVEVHKRHFARWTGSVPVMAHVTTNLDVAISRGAACTGIVRDERGDPVAQANVTVRPGPDRYSTTRTDEQGEFRLDGITPGAFEISVRHKSLGVAQASLQAKDGQTVRRDLTLSRGIVFRGLVRGRGGKPLNRVRVSASGPWNKDRTWNRYERTGTDGVFELTNCPTGAVLKLRLERRGYATFDKMKLDATTGPLEFTMEWEGEPTARIIGRVLDPDGKPVGDAEISNPREGDGNSGVHTSKADGSIEITKLRPGSYSLISHYRNYPRIVTGPRKLSSGDTWDIGTLRFVHGGRLRLRAVNPTKLDRKKFYVRVHREDGTYASGFGGNPEQDLTLPIEPGRYIVKVVGRTVVPFQTKAAVEAGQESPVTVTIRVGHPVKLEFELPPNSDAVRELRYQLTGPDGLSYRRRMTRWRPFDFRHEIGLRPGRYQVRATTREGHEGELSIEVAAKTAQQAFRLKLR